MQVSGYQEKLKGEKICILPDEIGNPIHVLPEGAYCMLKGAFLDAFEDCPSCQFDRFGDQCVPAICEYIQKMYKRAGIGCF